MDLQPYLASLEPDYDPALHLLWSVAQTPGYHTRIPNGTRVHHTRGSADYALVLLAAGDDMHAARANDVLDALTALQVTDPSDSHCGIWGWFYEEPPQQMQPADFNWADFIGARLAIALGKFGRLLRPATREHVRTALDRAARAIHRRNVTPSYTNIAVMGGVVCAAAGELLAAPPLLEYGRTRLGNVLAHVEKIGGFTEYNSPTYTRVALEETERCLMLVRDPATRDTAEKLRRIAWRALAERFHPGTGQMAGPQSRAYSDWVQPDLARYLSSQTGATITPRIAGRDEMNLASTPGYEPVTPMPCPHDFADRFKHLPTDPLEVVTRFDRKEDWDTIGTTWLTRDACLGSVNRGIGWIQQRATLGYWRTAADPAICFRLRMLKQGHDLAASRSYQVQKGPRILSSWVLLHDAGDHHPTLGVPADSIFDVTDLRLRIQIEGAGVVVHDLGHGRFELAAGDWRVIVHTAPATFDDQPVHWESGSDTATAYVDAVLYAGVKKPIDFHRPALALAAGLEMISRSVEPRAAALQSEREPGADRVRWTWGDLELTSPTHPAPFGW